MPPRRTRVQVNYKEVVSSAEESSSNEDSEGEGERRARATNAGFRAPSNTDGQRVDGADSQEAEMGATSSATSVKPQVQQMTVTYDYSGIAERPRKIRKTSTVQASSGAKGGRKRKARLEAFVHMPMDILFEISGHLDPLALLQLSRVSKALRQLFTSKSAKPLWARARANLNLPDLQSDNLTEMAYASLKFERRCMLCGAGRASIVNYDLQVRWCRSCKQRNLKSELTLDKHILGYGHLHRDTMFCSFDTLTSLTGANKLQRDYYYWPQIFKVDRLLRGCEKRVKQAAASDLEADPIGKDSDDTYPPESLRRLVKRLQRNVASARKDAVALREWVDPREQLVLPRKKRVTMFWHTIRAAIVAQMERNLASRLGVERNERKRARRELIPSLREALIAGQPTALEGVSFPDVYSFFHLPSVRPFWEPDQPDGYVVDQACWLAALAGVMADVERWRMKQRRPRASEMRRAMAEAGVPLTSKAASSKALGTSAMQPRPDVGQGSEAPPDSLPPPRIRKPTPPAIRGEGDIDTLLGSFLARFVCTSCHSLHPYPQVLLHEHNRHHGSSHYSCASGAWIKSLGAILEQADFDASTVTEPDLESLGAVFECRDCTDHAQMIIQGNRGAEVKTSKLTWRELITHACSQHLEELKHFEPRRGKFVQLRIMETEQDGAA